MSPLTLFLLIALTSLVSLLSRYLNAYRAAPFGGVARNLGRTGLLSLPISLLALPPGLGARNKLSQLRQLRQLSRVYAPLGVGLCLLLSTSNAEAAIDSTTSTFNNIQYTFVTYVEEFRLQLKWVAEVLLFYLTIIAIAWTGINMLFKQGTLQSFMIYLVRLFIVIGLFKFLIVNSYDIASDIMASLSQLVTDTFGTSFNISEPFNELFNLIETYGQAMARHNIIFAVFFLGLAFIVVAIIIANYITIYLESYMVSSLGIFVLGFGALKLTRSIAINYFKLVLVYSVRIFALNLLLNIGQVILRQTLEQISLSVSNGNPVTLQEAGLISIILVILLWLSFTLPRALASLISNAFAQPSSFNPVRRYLPA